MGKRLEGPKSHGTRLTPPTPTVQQSSSELHSSQTPPPELSGEKALGRMWSGRSVLRHPGQGSIDIGHI